MIRREAEGLKIEVEKEDFVGKQIKLEKDSKQLVNVQAVFKDTKQDSQEELKQEKLSSITEVDESEDPKTPQNPKTPSQKTKILALK